jgi:hypothetical protein
MIQRGLLVDALPQTKAAAQSIHQHLTTMGGGVVGVGQLQVQFGLSL